MSIVNGTSFSVSHYIHCSIVNNKYYNKQRDYTVLSIVNTPHRQKYMFFLKPTELIWMSGEEIKL